MSFLSGYQLNSINMSKSISVKRLNRSKLNHSSSVTSIGGVGVAGMKTFYHHTNIFNLKHYKHLTDHIIDGTDIDEIKNHQRSLLIREFRHKVDQYLLFSKYRKEQATRDFNTYYAKIQDQLFKTEGYEANRSSSIKVQESIMPNGGISFLSINNEDQNQSISIIQPEFNKSLLNIDANRFNYSKLSKQEASLINNMSIDIYLEDQFGKQKHTTHKFDHKKLQDYILNKMKYYLSNDTEYDKKIEYFTKEYERILEKIQTQSFRVKVPLNYTPQMQPFNEYYSIDYTKLKETPKNIWKDIDDELMNQVLEDAQLSEEEIEEEEDVEDEVSSYEEYEEEIEKSEVHKKSEKDLENIEEKKDLEYMNYRIQKQQNKQQKSNQEEAFKIIQETQVNQIIIVKKKKKKVKKVEQDQEQEINNIDQNQTQNQQTITPKKRRRNQNDQKGERSAMDEYLIYRPTSPEKPKRKEPQKKQHQAVQRPATKKVVQPTVGTPQSQNKQGRVPPLRTNIPDQPQQRGQTSNDSSKQQDNSNLKSKSDTNGEEEGFKERILPQNTTDNRISQKTPSGLVNQDAIYQQSQFVTEEDINSGANSNNAIPMDMTEQVRIGRSPQVGKMGTIEQTEQKYPQNIPSQPNTERESTPGKQLQVQDSKVGISQFKKEEEDEYEEEIIIIVPEAAPTQQNEIVQVQQKETQIDKKPSISLSPREKEQTKGNQTPKSPQIQPKIPQQAKKQQQPNIKFESYNPSAMNTPKAGVINTPSHRDSVGFNYLADNKVKKRVGTGLIDDLVKSNYLLDFDSNQFKKERKLPEMPKDLEFRQNDDKQLFDSIFKWQYEIDQDIEEMEAKLDKKGQNKNRHEDSDDEDDDDRDSQGKKSSIHSSDITDFGEPAPDKNTLQNVSYDGLSDIG